MFKELQKIDLDESPNVVCDKKIDARERIAESQVIEELK